MSQLPKGPWAWRNFGGRLYLVADHGRRDVILGAPDEIFTRNDDGLLRPIDPYHPVAIAIERLPDLIDALECFVSATSAVMPTELVAHFGASRAKAKSLLEKIKRETPCETES